MNLFHLLALALWCGAFGVVAFVLSFVVLRFLRLFRRKRIVGLFHPYCNAGGGGERVLWCAVRALQSLPDECRIVVYTGDLVSAATIYQNVQDAFGFDISRVEFVYLRTRFLTYAQMWPVFTLLGQSLGSLVLGYEALLRCLPDIYIDTMGYAFTMPLFRYLGGCRVGCYTHYPTISTDMMGKVLSGDNAVFNRRFIASSPVLTRLKMWYYVAFASAYAMVGRCAEAVLVNSTWTSDHIAALWGAPPRIVFPPCDTSAVNSLPLDGRGPYVVSLGQFRPEKNHELQLLVFARVLALAKEKNIDLSSSRLWMIGGCRDEIDLARLNALRARAAVLGIESQVEFFPDAKLAKKIELLRAASVGIHTMWNEHFGIAVVELMAAGCVTVAHRSGGPLHDIIGNTGTKGFLAEEEEDYAAVVFRALTMSPESRRRIQLAAREAVSGQYSDEVFQRNFLSGIAPLL
eukprot:gnl/Spiro4/14761_TR7953_c0_g1_i1.p1 gnl/Spiro4/14761_TR7953_c0_g1~~gnl/Spiro4/14761_TR7953_c0_g1_i1.p1  ORF type:complete len:477 (-),score=116.46 gnl/Spiro4/14761_TR7953_c0_g1_i1:33-1412(-)